MLFAAPLVVVQIGGVGSIGNFITLNSARILAVVLLLPLLLATNASRRRTGISYAMPDRIIVCYVILMIILEFRKSEFTHVMRVAVLYTLDVLIPYFALSRTITNVAEFRKVLLAFVIAALPLAVIGVFETVRTWHLYKGAFITLGGDESATDLRGAMLRASASGMNPVVYGIVIMVAIGSALALRLANVSRDIARAALGVLTVGLVVCLSRGPWVATAALFIAYLITGPNPVRNLSRALLLGGGVGMLLALTPFGAKMLNYLPFVGSGDESSVNYRQKLLENGMLLIEQNPWFGSASFLQTKEMQEMIQGQGIIDVVNVYLYIALYSGLIGLSLFVGFFAAILIGLRRTLVFKSLPIDIRVCARALIATLLAILTVLGTTASIDFIPYTYWSFAGLCVAFIRIGHATKRTVSKIAVLN